ncbi:MAG: PAS domain S-box protein [Flavobacteriales bacterium]|nr:PAS domain S-box protein [Flavobacteriales bacterium]
MISSVNRNLEIAIEKSRFLKSFEASFEHVSYTGLEVMNEMSSEIISTVRKRRMFSPVVILTDTVDVQTAVKWMKLGVDDVLDISRYDELESVVRELIPNYQDKIESKASGHYLHMLAEYLDEIIFEFDYSPTQHQKWKLNYLSPSFEKILGYKTNHFLENQVLWGSIIHPDDIYEMTEKTRLVIRSQKSGYRRYRMRHHLSGEYVWIEDHISTVTNEAGAVSQLVGIARDVDAEHKATKELETKQLLLAEAERLANMGSWKYDIEKSHLEISDSLKRILGIEEEQMLDSPQFLEHFVPIEERSEIRRFLDVVSLNGQAKEHDHSVISNRGDRIQVQTTLRALRNQNGELKGFLGTTQNITDRKESEQKINESKKFIESIIETSPSIIYVIDYNTKLMTHGMKRFAEYFGYSPEEVEVMPNGVDDLVHPDDIEAVQKQELLLASSEKGTVVPTEFRLQHREGHWVWVAIHSKIFEWDKNGRPSKGIGSVVDINKRKESDKKFEAVAENAIAGIFIMQNDRLTYANPAIAEITGYSIPELTEIHFLEFLHPSIRKEAANFPLKLLKRRSRRFRNEQIVVRKDKTERYAEITTSIINFEGNPALLGVVFDISDRKRSEIERNELIDRLTTQNKNLEDFSYIISHKLRSPVASILGLIELMDPSEFSSQNEEMMGHLLSSTQNLDEVIQDLAKTMSIKKISFDQMEKVETNQALRSVKQALADRIEKSKAMVVVDIPEGQSFVTNRSFLKNILYNLLSNAIKFRNPDRNLVIKVQSSIIGNHVEITVKDNGMGIDMEVNRDRVFKLYERFHPEINGRGIGLHLVKTQVETLGGSLSVESEIDKGSTFKILLPKPKM